MHIFDDHLVLNNEKETLQKRIKILTDYKDNIVYVWKWEWTISPRLWTPLGTWQRLSIREPFTVLDSGGPWVLDNGIAVYGNHLRVSPHVIFKFRNTRTPGTKNAYVITFIIFLTSIDQKFRRKCINKYWENKIEGRCDVFMLDSDTIFLFVSSGADTLPIFESGSGSLKFFFSGIGSGSGQFPLRSETRTSRLHVRHLSVSLFLL